MTAEALARGQRAAGRPARLRPGQQRPARPVRGGPARRPARRRGAAPPARPTAASPPSCCSPDDAARGAGRAAGADRVSSRPLPADPDGRWRRRRSRRAATPTATPGQPRRLGSGSYAPAATPPAVAPAQTPTEAQELTSRVSIRPPPPGTANARHVRQEVIEATDDTTDGLPRRVRQTSLAPQLRDGRPTEATTIASTSRPVLAHPEELRAMMTSFQAGMNRGRARPESSQRRATRRIRVGRRAPDDDATADRETRGE